MGLYEDMLERIGIIPDAAKFPELYTPPAAEDPNVARMPRWSDLPQTLLPPHMRSRTGAVDASTPAVQAALGNIPQGPNLPPALRQHATMMTDAGLLAPLDQPAAPLTPEQAAMQQLVSPNARAEPVPLPMARPADPVPMPRPRPAPSEEVSSRARTAGGVEPSVPAPPMPIAPTAPQVGMGPATPSFLDRIQSSLGNNSNTLLALGAGFAGAPGWGQAISRASAAAIPARAADIKQSLERETRGVTTRALMEAGVPTQLALAAQRDPDLKKALIQKYLETKPAQVVNGRLVREHADGTVTELANYGDDLKPPAGFRWRDDSKTTLDYIPNGPADPKYLREKGERNAAPAGYVWVDPEKPEAGLRAIPGGPGEKVDAQVAARMGLAKNFLKQLPKIKEDVQKGMATGVINAGMAYTGYGRAGELRRQIESGAEALLRNLTGAGMSIPEAERYVRRYELQPHDTIDRVMSKLGQLEVELGATLEEVGKGRGGSQSPTAVPKPGVYVWDPKQNKLVPAK